jgi:hypothetical protein
MNDAAANTSSEVESSEVDLGLWAEGLRGVEYLDAWRALRRPFPGSVPPMAGFAGVDAEASTDGEPEQPIEHIDGSIAAVVRSITALTSIDPADLDTQTLATLVEGVEQARRMIDAAATQVAGAIDTRNPFRSQGYLNAKTYLKQRCQLSGPEAYRRIQSARMRDRLSEWTAAARTGRVGVAQSEAMARVAANPRIDPSLLARDAGMLLDDAIALPFDEFERNLRTWEALADPVGDDAKYDRANARRHVELIPRPEGGWNVTGFLPELAGVEFAEIFAWYCEAEWRIDWADARHRLGDAATQSDLVRTDAQRRADALLAMARASVSRDPNVARPSASAVCVDILLDHDTMVARAAGATPDPARFRNVVCRTTSGRRLHPDDAINAALIGHIRRVVYDGSGTVIQLGRRSRLFRGSAREAVMLLLTTCVWIGCDRPVAWCDADHSLGWKAHGATVPRNGQPLCTGHQNLKETGYQVFRDDHGHWHIIDPDGNELG